MSLPTRHAFVLYTHTWLRKHACMHTHACMRACVCAWACVHVSCDLRRVGRRVVGGSSKDGSFRGVNISSGEPHVQQSQHLSVIRTFKHACQRQPLRGVIRKPQQPSFLHPRGDCTQRRYGNSRNAVPATQVMPLATHVMPLAMHNARNAVPSKHATLFLGVVASPRGCKNEGLCGFLKTRRPATGRCRCIASRNSTVSLQRSTVSLQRSTVLVHGRAVAPKTSVTQGQAHRIRREVDEKRGALDIKAVLLTMAIAVYLDL